MGSDRVVLRKIRAGQLQDDPPDPDRLLAILRHDKKAAAGRLRFVLPTAVGAVTEADDVTDDEVREALAALRG